MLSQTRNLAAAKAFFKQALTIVGHKLKRVTTDKHVAYRRAIRRILGRKVLHRTNQYLNNRIDQDHRARWVRQLRTASRKHRDARSAWIIC
jgi:putative transposase